MTEARTPKLLADKLEAYLQDYVGAVDCACESVEEAEAVEAEMTRRGWRARVRMALVGNSKTNLFEVVSIVEVARRKKSKARR